MRERHKNNVKRKKARGEPSDLSFSSSVTTIKKGLSSMKEISPYFIFMPPMCQYALKGIIY